MAIVSLLILIFCCLALIILGIKQWVPGGRIIQFPLEVGATLLGITFAINLTLVKVEQDFSVNTYTPTFVQNLFSKKDFSDNSTIYQANNRNSKQTTSQTTHNQQNDYSSTDNSSSTWLQSLAQQTANLFSSGEEKEKSAPEASTVSSSHPRIPSSPVAVAVQENNGASRFFAIRTGSQGKGVKVRLYDSRARDWLDDETHSLSKEPREGGTVQVGGVQAVYKKKR